MCYLKDGTLHDRREMLRVKIKSLMEEARIIRREESRTGGVLRCELSAHRRGPVRASARDSHIAYGLMRGLPLDRIERTRKSEPDWKAVRSMIKRYGPKDFAEPACMQGK